MKHTMPRVSRRGFLAGAAALAGSRVRAQKKTKGDAADAAPSAYTLHFAQPASKWPNALPVGNGRLGAMVFGEPGVERIGLNEESIWDGEPGRDRNNPKAGAAIPRIRELLFAGKVAEAEALAVSDVLSVPRRMPCYQTLGDLHLDFRPSSREHDGSTVVVAAITRDGKVDVFPPQDASAARNTGVSPLRSAPVEMTSGMGAAGVEEYRLQLDLDTAVVTTTFRRDGVTYRREVFSSAPDQCVVVRLTASERGKIAFRATLDRPQNFELSSPELQRLIMTGQALPVNDNPGLPVKEHQTGVRFHAELRLIAEGKSASFPLPDSLHPGLEVENADAVTLLIDCATSYRYPARAGKPSGVDADVLVGDAAAMRAAVDRNLKAAARRSYAELKARHVADHQRYFRRAAFDLGPDPRAAVPTDVRVKTIKDGGEDVHLLPIYFQFGRYMLIGSSRPGTLAANLQGIWNDSVDPPWGCKYTVNINAEMNYWFAESANLSEFHLPLFDLLRATRAQGAVTARELYGAKGSVVHHNTDVWGDSGPIDGLGGGLWAMGASWMSLHLWRHYAFTGDEQFLREQAYPAFRENAVFLLDYMVKDPKTGKLTTGPSCSPENAYELNGKSYNLCMGPTMDISIARAVFARLLKSASVLKNDDDLVQKVRAAYDQLPPFQIAHDGRLQEWPEDYKDHEPGHRHISHLFGLYPDDQITVDGTPELARAARTVLDKRLAAGGGSTGWSRSWVLNCMARLGDGEACYANIRELFVQSTRPNLFDVCGLKENSPFQIDGNLGAPSGLIEMLVQSHGATPLRMADWSAEKMAPVIRLLPALPKAWPSGSFRGLRARGGVEIDLQWSGGKATSAVLRTSVAGTKTIVLPKGQRLGSVMEGSRAMKADMRADGAVLLAMKAGVEYRVVLAG